MTSVSVGNELYPALKLSSAAIRFLTTTGVLEPAMAWNSVASFSSSSLLSVAAALAAPLLLLLALLPLLALLLLPDEPATGLLLKGSNQLRPALLDPAAATPAEAAPAYRPG